MHAHNITHRAFQSARYLYKKVNQELNDAIGKRIVSTGEKTMGQRTDVNQAILAAIDAMNENTVVVAFEKFNQLAKIVRESSPMIQNASQLIQNINPELQRLLIEANDTNLRQLTEHIGVISK